MGIRVVMLTGDNEQTARAIGAQAGVDEVIAGVLPEGKEEVIRRLKNQGKVAMVGDGINDAPALTRADMGMRSEQDRYCDRCCRCGIDEEQTYGCSGSDSTESCDTSQHS